MGFIPDVERICLAGVAQCGRRCCSRRPCRRRSAGSPRPSSAIRRRSPWRRPRRRPRRWNRVWSCHARRPGQTRRRCAALIADARDDVRERADLLQPQAGCGVLHKSLLKHGFMPASLHGDLVSARSTEVLDAFKSGRDRALRLPDVAARGLDIPDVSHVFNFDVPATPRITSTASAAPAAPAKPVSRSPSSRRRHQKYVAEIERLIARKIDWVEGESLANVPGEDPRQGAARGTARRTPPEITAGRFRWRRSAGPPEFFETVRR